MNKKKVLNLIKEYPAIFGTIAFLFSLIPISIILYFTLGQEQSHKVDGYFIPFILAGLILVFFELTIVKHHKKEDK
jgi:hypothetical protein